MACRESGAPRVIILGAGVNGCSVARELVLNGVSTWVIDANDIGFGASSKSSRLIHGGLRYLEYGEFRLVQESLEERGRLRRLAPHFVRPLRLFIPVKSRLSGLAASALRFMGATRLGFMKNLTRKFRRARGLWLVDLGLAFYDWFAAGPEFPKHTVHELGAPGTPEIDSHRCRWLAAYSDAQMWGTERFCVALLDDARSVARERSLDFRVVTHADVSWDAGTLVITAGQATGSTDSMTAFRVRPELLVNATGAWGDRTLAGLNIPSPPLFGGTKGSHFLTWNRRLASALRGQGVYAEANDGRLVFLLPHGEAVLVGTTDERFDGPPEEAVASDAEIDYLIGMVNRLMPQVALTRDDIAMHYSGVRPLPRAEGTTASVSRDHAVVPAREDGTTVLTLVGGKLTTSRAFGESVADEVLRRLGAVRTADTRERVVPGNADYPRDVGTLERRIATLVERSGLTLQSAREVWTLFGTESERVLSECGLDDCTAERAEVIEGTAIPTSVVRWIVRNEWVATLEDLVERRLMLVFGRQLSQETLESVARCLVAEEKLADDDVERAIAATNARLLAYYGRHVTTALAEV
ncbi:MAG: glycerol-3-phosphate dehydrogenase/oxidase [Planctomycetaceae bacterium]|nr:glycerol-3-phosphate dehydrogenase/oxidase [Planctomycetaceae bacterium]